MNARKASAGGRRDYVIQIRVNAEEMAEVQKLSEALGYSTLSEYLRQVALGYRQAYRKDLKSDEERKEEEQD